MLKHLLHTHCSFFKHLCTSAQDCFELGVILLRKKLYTQATKNLEKASRMWDGEPEELAQVHMLPYFGSSINLLAQNLASKRPSYYSVSV